jgi:hypothetical protein
MLEIMNVRGSFYLKSLYRQRASVLYMNGDNGRMPVAVMTFNPESKLIDLCSISHAMIAQQYPEAQEKRAAG